MSKSKVSNALLSTMVDRLGSVKAQIARLDREENRIRKVLVESRVREVDGKLFRATISRATQPKLDMDAVRAKLSAQFIVAHTKDVPVVSVRVVARTRMVRKNKEAA